MTPNQDRGVPAGSAWRSPEPRPRHDAVRTVYDDIVRQLRHHGWIKGSRRRGDALCLVEAIDAAVGVDEPAEIASASERLARAGRVGAHLRDLVGVRSLASWSEEPSRTLDDVLQVLADAAIAFPED